MTRREYWLFYASPKSYGCSEDQLWPICPVMAHTHTPPPPPPHTQASFTCTDRHI
ncbi:Hypothetical protein FKW44_001245 [Caligus rogercresseyi]|uniref:Uncharacterized protein n=1 Tax=Caligus rogercresseyi TaxID=217165 RepID=A0A7T8KIF6_CALRO|nr:Hypothetical protein FKW44_001245 [Caligus rogercresseyi]